MKKLICPTCKNEEFGYITKNILMCLKCGRIFYRPVKEYNFGIKNKKVLVEFIPEKNCKN